VSAKRAGDCGVLVVSKRPDETTSRTGRRAVAKRTQVRSMRRLARSRHPLEPLPRRIAEPADFERLPGAASGRIHGQRPREGADVQPVAAVARPAVSALPHLDHVGPVPRNHRRRDGVLLHQRRVVRLGEHEAIGVEDRQVRVEKGLAEPDPLDLGREPLSLLQLDGKVIDVLVFDDSVHRDINRDLLRLLEVVVRLRFLNLRQRAYAEQDEVAHPRGGPQPESVLAQRAVRGNCQPSLYAPVLLRFDLQRTNARLVEDQLLGVAEPGAGQNGVQLRAPLSAVGGDAGQLRVRGNRPGRRQEQGEAAQPSKPRPPPCKCADHRVPPGPARVSLCFLPAGSAAPVLARGEPRRYPVL